MIFPMAVLLIALAEMAMASGLGAKLEASTLPSAHAFWFGEDQARYVVTAKASDAEQAMASLRAQNVPVQKLGIVAGNGHRDRGRGAGRGRRSHPALSNPGSRITWPAATRPSVCA